MAFVVGSILAASPAPGATYTWTGGSSVSNAWSDSANWLGGAIPTSDSANTVVFNAVGPLAGSTPNSLQNLTPTPYALNQLSFAFPSGAGDFVLSGGSIVLSGATSLSQDSSVVVTINNNLSLGSGASAFAITGDGSSPLILNGFLSASAQPFTKSGQSYLTLGGGGNFLSASFTNGPTIQSGGTQTISRVMTISHNSFGGRTTYTLNAGALSAQGINVDGTAGESILYQNGGQVGAASGGLTVSGLDGQYFLNAGTLNVSGGALNVTSNATFWQYAGAITASTFNVSGIRTAYLMYGGALSAASGVIGAGSILSVGGGSRVQFTGAGLNLSGFAPNLGIGDGATLVTTDLVCGMISANISLTDPPSSVSALTITQGFSSTCASPIQDGINGPGGITKAGTGAWTLSAANTYSGPTRITGGTLTLTANGSIANSSLIAVSSGATFNVSAKAAPGLVVSSGQTLNNNGTVTGSLAVRGTLSGAGTVSGGVLVESAATLSPGNSPGILNTGGLTLNSGSTTILELSNATAGTGYDRLNVTGAVMLGNGTLNLLQTLPAGLAAGTNFFVLTNDGTDAVVGTFLGLAQDAVIVSNGTGFRISYTGDLATNTFEGTGNDVVLQNITAVPEPGGATLLLLGGGVGAVAFARRSRRQTLTHTRKA